VIGVLMSNRLARFPLIKETSGRNHNDDHYGTNVMSGRGP
jgi:hypothetical protein